MFSLYKLNLKASLIHEYALRVDLIHLHWVLLFGNLELGISDDILEFIHLSSFTRAFYLICYCCSQHLLFLFSETAFSLLQIVISYCSFELAWTLFSLFG